MLSTRCSFGVSAPTCRLQALWSLFQHFRANLSSYHIKIVYVCLRAVYLMFSNSCRALAKGSWVFLKATRATLAQPFCLFLWGTAECECRGATSTKICCWPCSTWRCWFSRAWRPCWILSVLVLFLCGDRLAFLPCETLRTLPLFLREPLCQPLGSRLPRRQQDSKSWVLIGWTWSLVGEVYTLVLGIFARVFHAYDVLLTPLMLFDQFCFSENILTRAWLFDLLMLSFGSLDTSQLAHWLRRQSG